ncbi:hypothetical protein AX16_010135 [Volvariella volvacea WC 439]|nr:hypothetical protein AX16_010135 [Volvariella volvacea WC 439]
MSSDQEIGTLVVVVLKAQNLIDKHSFYKQDVYAKVTLNGKEQKTKVDVKGGQHPVWDEELRFPIFKATGDKYRKLEVSCYSKEHRSDDHLGTGSIDVVDTLKSGEFDDWVPLSIDGVARGDVYLEMTFFSSGPAPAPKYSSGSLTLPNNGLLRRPSKLAPETRLSRPPQQNHQQGPRPNSGYGGHNSGARIPAGNGHLHPNSPPGSRPSSRPPSKSDYPLPSLPETGISPPRPSSLAPAGGNRPGSSGGQPQDVPNFLRPGSGNPAAPLHSSRPGPQPPHVPDHNKYTVASPPPINNTHNTSPHASPNPYISHPTSAPRLPTIPGAEPPPTSFTPLPPPVHSYTAPIPATSPFSWGPSPTPAPSEPPSVSFSFPVPLPSVDIPPIQSPAQTPYSQAPFIQPQNDPYRGNPTPAIPDYRAPYQGPFSPPPAPPPPQQRENLPDPYLFARYQTPLPLPPGATSTSPPRTEQRAVTPPKPWDSAPPNYPPRQPEHKPTIDENRLLAHRYAEEEAARRKAQEDKDLELALQLDRELNL